MIFPLFFYYIKQTLFTASLTVRKGSVGRGLLRIGNVILISVYRLDGWQQKELGEFHCRLPNNRVKTVLKN